MKLPVKEIRQLELEYDGTNSELICLIFKDIFKICLDSYEIEIKNEKDGIGIYHDVSLHGSPTYERIKLITDKNEIELCNLLVKTYELLKNMENNKK